MATHYSEEQRIEKVQDGEWGWKEYIASGSIELRDEFERFCQFKGYDPEVEESAVLFMAHRDKQFEEALNIGEV